ncbi:GNAT family protein [Streptomyces sp. H27-C3]|uniref:GNAT family N-acetyltransferase n=1 Tax=Streptomyces sp. H27-C3 TaxID=3046305 RepID=UPI0024B8BB40|nr:GNAT family protein [Streptomyces sp. H27-C3]MDJ0464202.1 GNAT family protein [Streptomyces sp. H27-C3]
MTNHPGPPLRFVELPAAAMTALLDKDLVKASALTGVELTDLFLTDGLMWLWRYRLGQLAGDPGGAPWILRILACGADGAVVGHAGFHGPPDDVGMVEVGYGVLPEFRRRGHARAMLVELLSRAATDPGVTTVRASISPGNVASEATIADFGFEEVGELWDEEDGMETLYERPARPTAVGPAAEQTAS